MHLDLHTWLASDKPYAAGVALLQEHGKPTKALLELLASENGYTRERLEEAISELAGSATPTNQPKARLHPAAEAKATEGLLNPVGGDDWELHRYPVELQEVKLRQRDLYREYDALRGALPHVPTKEERYRTALRIKELDDTIHAAHYRLDTFRNTGTDIGAVNERPKSLAELIRERDNIRTYLSRVAKGTRAASEEQIATWKRRLQILQTTIDARPEI